MADIAWDPHRTDEAEAAWAELGRHLGFTAQQPELDFKIGSDALWAFPDGTLVVTELKTGSGSSTIWKKDINQLAGSVNWCQGEYGLSANVVPLMVHPVELVDNTGTPPHGTLVVNKSKLKHLKDSMRLFAAAVSLQDAYRDPAKLELQFQHFRLDQSILLSEFTARARRATE